jgi:hypothetical protein
MLAVELTHIKCQYTMHLLATFQLTDATIWSSNSGDLSNSTVCEHSALVAGRPQLVAVQKNISDRGDECLRHEEMLVVLLCIVQLGIDSSTDNAVDESFPVVIADSDSVVNVVR